MPFLGIPHYCSYCWREFPLYKGLYGSFDKDRSIDSSVDCYVPMGSTSMDLMLLSHIWRWQHSTSWLSKSWLIHILFFNRNNKTQYIVVWKLSLSNNVKLLRYSFPFYSVGSCLLYHEPPLSHLEGSCTLVLTTLYIFLTDWDWHCNWNIYLSFS